MKKINLKELEIYTDISQKQKQIIDVKDEFANLLYTKANGMAARSLAFKIYEANGEVEIDENEEALIKQINEMLIPVYIDAINKQLK